MCTRPPETAAADSERDLNRRTKNSQRSIRATEESAAALVREVLFMLPEYNLTA